MFTGFLFHLRARGLKVTVTEWLTLMRAITEGHSRAELSHFYHLARALLIKRETQYDLYDQAFAEYFQGLEHHFDISDELPDKLRAIGCFASQIPERRADRGHYVRGLGPLERTETRDRFFGSQVGADAAEPFWSDGPMRIDDPAALL